MPGYTAAAVVAVAAVVAHELVVRRSGVFGWRPYWLAMGVCVSFMVPVDGWLTKLSAPIVRYDPGAHVLGRFPWDIPVEDFLFGFALLTTVLARWRAAAGIEAGAPAGEGR